MAEAAVLIARLHGGERTRADAETVSRWLQADPENAAAFELATAVWDDSANLRRVIPLAPPKRPRWPTMTVSLVLSGLVIAVVASLFWVMQAKTTTTAVGEQRRIALDDGSNVLLDSGTRISVRYDRRLRRVQLLSGEALFDVAKQPDWPFIVQVGDRQVRAVGTTFSVLRDNDRMVVTLVKGIVTVSSDARFRLPLVGTPQAAQGIAGDGEVLTLSPGERLTFAAGAAPSVDRPSLDQTMAWVRGQVVFDNTPLSRAAAEMNRYSAVRLTIDANDAEQLPVSGVFQLGASESFARAVAQLYGLAAVAGGGEIRLSGEPKLPTRVGAAKAARS